MKSTIVSLLMVFMFLAVIPEADAQRRGKKKRRPAPKEERESSREDKYKTPISERMVYDVFLGNVVLSRDFQLTSKFGASYKLTEWLQLGANLQATFGIINMPNDDINYTDFGFGPLIRGKIAENFYAQVEYDINSYNTFLDSGFLRPGITGTDATKKRVTKSGIAFGGGYFSGFGPWKFGIQVMINPNDEINDIDSIVDYLFGATYQF